MTTNSKELPNDNADGKEYSNRGQRNIRYQEVFCSISSSLVAHPRNALKGTDGHATFVHYSPRKRPDDGCGVEEAKTLPHLIKPEHEEANSALENTMKAA